jgi:hypothetical protein
MVFASSGVISIGVILGLILVGPSGLSALMMSIRPPWHIIGGILALTISGCLTIFKFYPFLRDDEEPITAEIVSAAIKSLYFFLIPLTALGWILIGDIQEAINYYIGIGICFFILTASMFFSAMLAEAFRR